MYLLKGIRFHIRILNLLILRILKLTRIEISIFVKIKDPIDN